MNVYSHFCNGELENSSCHRQDWTEDKSIKHMHLPEENHSVQLYVDKQCVICWDSHLPSHVFQVQLCAGVGAVALERCLGCSGQSSACASLL